MLGEAGAAAEAAFARVLQRYRETSGHEPYVVEGSSAGALQFQTRTLAEANTAFGTQNGNLRRQVHGSGKPGVQHHRRTVG